MKMSSITDYMMELSFLAVLIRSFISGAAFSDAAILISLVLSIVYVKSYLPSKIQVIDESLREEIEEIKSKMTALNFKNSIQKVNLNEQKEKTAGSPGRRF